MIYFDTLNIYLNLIFFIVEQLLKHSIPKLDEEIGLFDKVVLLAKKTFFHKNEQCKLNGMAVFLLSNST